MTTTKTIKEIFYPDNVRVLDIETLIIKCQEHAARWEHYNYTDEQLQQKEALITNQMSKHSNHPFVMNYYNQQLGSLGVEV